jgi:hypothetical protein
MVEDLIERYPRLYHMAFAECYGSILKRGLLSAKRLVEAAQIDDEQRSRLLTQRRPDSVRLTTNEGEFWLRDQKPLSEKRLASCLEGGLTPSQWCESLNSRIYFWVRENKVRELLSAGAYAAGNHVVLVVDTRSLIDEYRDHVRLAAMNTGATRPMAFTRGPDTFKPLDTYPFAFRRKKGLEPVIEFTILDGVPNIEEHLVAVEHWEAGTLTRVENKRN